MRSLAYSSVQSNAAARRGDAGDGDRQPLLGQVGHEVHEALALVAEQVGHRHVDVGEEQLGGVLAVHADLVEVAAALEAVHAALEHEQATCPCGAGVGSVLTAVITRSALMPLVMNVFEPLTT